MTRSLLDLSGKIDQLSVSLYEVLSRVAASNNTQFFVVGATARDTILVHGYGIPIRRATVDVDIGLRVSDWKEFNRLKEGLIGTNQFVAAEDVQRVLYKGHLPVDIVPFGAIGQPDKQIKWPPHHAVMMSILGFEDAYRAAQLVRVRADPPLDILFANLPGLATMKIAVWSDRPLQRGKDARDLAHIMRIYLDAGHYERFVEQHGDLLEVENFDYVKASARLLGRDIAEIMAADTKRKILEILEAETAEQGRYRLIQDMMAGSLLTDEENDNHFEEHLGLLRNLKEGIREA